MTHYTSDYCKLHYLGLQFIHLFGFGVIVVNDHSSIIDSYTVLLSVMLINNNFGFLINIKIRPPVKGESFKPKPAMFLLQGLLKFLNKRLL